MYPETYKTLMKETEDNMNKWKFVPCPWIRINIVKVTILPKAIYGFSAIPIRIPMSFFRNGTNNSKICMELQKAWNIQNLEKEQQTGNTMLPGFKVHYKTIAIKTVWYWYKNRHTQSVEHNRAQYTYMIS